MHINIRLLGFTFLLLFLGYSCGENPGSCKSEALHACIDYLGSDYDIPGAQDNCETITDGVYSSDSCDDTDVIATCLLDEEKSTEREYLYFEDDDFDVTGAESSCELLDGNFEAE